MDASTPPRSPTDHLRGSDGIDTDAGLAAVGGRTAVYERLLGVFLRAHDGDAARIAQALDGGAGNGGADPRALAHRLRGSAATLGLVAVEQAAAAIERTAPDAEAAEMPQRVAELQVALDAALARLREALGG